MTNKEWLEYLAHNAPDELAAWFDSEHVETANGTLDGDTAAENADSRERLEADARKIADAYNMDSQRHGTERFAHELYYSIIHLLDRQAAITEREYGERMVSEAMCSRICVVVSEQREQIAELTAERDEWKSRWETGKAQFDAILAERELYREALSQLLDTVTEGMGKVSALLDNYDEGMA